MEFQKGMDLSFIPELEDAGVQVKDFDGTVMDPLDLVQKYGVNSVRLRIWNAPEHVRESGGAYTGDGKTDPGTWHELYAGFPLF